MTVAATAEKAEATGAAELDAQDEAITEIFAPEPVMDDPACAKIVLTRNPVDSFVSTQLAYATDQWKLNETETPIPARIRHAPVLRSEGGARAGQGSVNRGEPSADVVNARLKGAVEAQLALLALDHQLRSDQVPLPGGAQGDEEVLLAGAEALVAGLLGQGERADREVLILWEGSAMAEAMRGLVPMFAQKLDAVELDAAARVEAGALLARFKAEGLYV